MFQIYYGSKATTLEITACQDLQHDLETIQHDSVQLAPLPNETPKEWNTFFPKLGYIIIVGSPDTNSLIQYWSQNGNIPLTSEQPGRRGAIIHLLSNLNPANPNQIIVLGGSDPQGAQYAVYEFSHSELGIDPFAYWTGYFKIKNVTFSSSIVKQRVIKPPLVPILAYFDNDNDELANLNQPYLEFSIEQWQELIKTLVRLKYNAIDIHDHLGRAEFYRWPYYKALRPNYEPNVKLLNQVIDYAHERGVKIQVSFYLGWKFKVISDKASLNWAKYKQEWLEVWKYYLKETPIGKCDIFLNRPRDQRWDRKYQGKGRGNDSVTVFNEVFPAMTKIIKEHNPNAIIIVDLYSEGRVAYQKGFRPQPKKDYIMAWPDNGFGKFDYMPKDMDSYNWGIYMHAGFFLNHVVQDPYPQVLAESMKNAFENYKMTSYCLVNGQTFRHFIFNIEACSKICQDPSNFDTMAYFTSWVTRYFGTTNTNEVVSILQILHQVQEPRWGYINLLSHLKYSAIRLELMKKIPFIPLRLINRIFEKIGKLGPTFTQLVANNTSLLEKAIQMCAKISPTMTDQNHFFHDHVILPVTLLFQLYQIAYNLQKASTTRKNKLFIAAAQKSILEHHQTRIKGDKNTKWKGWYDPNKRRPNGGYFDIDILQEKGQIRIIKNR